ncbi:MAG: phosphonate ABC transporter, permease protein PhnE [Chthoniobacterales bacterium]|nr:phosphonate ABC transporter, permease protein PhnE [Chthoniobacterales bacterium]
MRGADRKMDYFGNFVRFVERFFPPDFSVFEEVWKGLLESIQMAVVATAMAILASLPLAVAGARTISPIWLVGIARMGLNIIRTVPGLVWALFAVAIFGANALAGVVGLAVYSVGYLGKFFSDALESVDMDAAVGLRAMGAHPLQAFQYGLWPYVKPLVWSYSLWMLEYNIRSASIIGYVGAGGVGLLLFTYQQYYQWDKFCTALLSILVLVTVLDLVGEWARKKVAKRVYRPLGSK